MLNKMKLLVAKARSCYLVTLDGEHVDRTYFKWLAVLIAKLAAWHLGNGTIAVKNELTEETVFAWNGQASASNV
jgi:hypothetical protein